MYQIPHVTISFFFISHLVELVQDDQKSQVFGMIRIANLTPIKCIQYWKSFKWNNLIICASPLTKHLSPYVFKKFLNSLDLVMDLSTVTTVNFECKMYQDLGKIARLQRKPLGSLPSRAYMVEWLVRPLSCKWAVKGQHRWGELRDHKGRSWNPDFGRSGKSVLDDVIFRLILQEGGLS